MLDHRPYRENRDWYSAPLQGSGRGSYDYGRTTLDRPRAQGLRGALAVVAVFVAYFAIQYARVLL